MILENCLLHYASPTLLGRKMASLFSLKKEAFFQNDFLIIGKSLEKHGLKMIILREDPYQLLVYVFREKSLLQLLNKNEVVDFLQKEGYQDFSPSYCLHKLKESLQAGVFPHEIGVFLDYPLEDVKGFIENKGKNWKYCGCWKVYKDPQYCKKLFASYEACKKECLQKYQLGCRLEECICDKEDL